MSDIMTSITTDIANAVDRVVNDVTTAAEEALPYIAGFAFELYTLPQWHYNQQFADKLAFEWCAIGSCRSTQMFATL